MSVKNRKLFKSAYYSITASIISLFASSLSVLILPKIMNDIDYGYFQLYLFYLGFSGILLWGWNDGIYLRYGGKLYDKINKNIVGTELYISIIFTIIQASLLAGGLINQFASKYMVAFIIIGGICSNIQSCIASIRLTTFGTKEYALPIIIGRSIYLLSLILCFVFQIADIFFVAFFELLSRIIQMIIAIFYSKELFKYISIKKRNIMAVLLNMKIGIKIMIASISGMLILGIVRYSISECWSIDVFGKISLILNVPMFFTAITNALGLVLFPYLKQIDMRRMARAYDNMKSSLTLLALLLFMMFFPLKYFMSIWLPNYIDYFSYMAIIFPVFLFDTRISLLINSYLKSLRMENILLSINVLVAFVCSIYTYVFAVIFGDLFFVVLGIVIMQMIRCVIAEKYLSKRLPIKVNSDACIDFVVIVNFVVLGFLKEYGLLFFNCILIAILYAYIKRNSLLVFRRE